jgi:hypothetical protein
MYDLCFRVTGQILPSCQRNNHRIWEKIIELDNAKPSLCLTSNITLKHSYICVTIFRGDYLISCYILSRLIKVTLGRNI